ncbi:MAG: hypothetical protein ACKVP4_06425 [Hyphomicrobium sp.]
MRKALIRLGYVLIGAVCLYVFLFPQYTHRFRLSFRVEVDGVPKEGSAVITVIDQNIKWLPLAQQDWKRTVKGPSPWVDLGDNGMLLAAIKANTASKPKYEPVPFHAGSLSFVAFFNAKHHDIKYADETIKKIRTLSGRRELTLDQLPQFIWLRDRSSPLSAQLVPPQKFPEVIGSGVRFVGAAVELTSDRPDGSLYAQLPWLREMARSEYVHGPTWSPTYKLDALDIVGD